MRGVRRKGAQSKTNENQLSLRLTDKCVVVNTAKQTAPKMSRRAVICAKLKTFFPLICVEVVETSKKQQQQKQQNTHTHLRDMDPGLKNRFLKRERCRGKT